MNNTYLQSWTFITLINGVQKTCNIKAFDMLDTHAAGQPSINLITMIGLYQFIYIYNYFFSPVDLFWSVMVTDSFKKLMFSHINFFQSVM